MKLRCDVCGRWLDSGFLLMRHVWIHHEKEFLAHFEDREMVEPQHSKCWTGDGHVCNEVR